MLSEIKKIFIIVLLFFFALSGRAQVDIVSDGTGAAYTITFPGVLSSYVWGTTFTFRAHIANTGACTINVNGLGTITIKNTAGTDLAANDILANQVVTITYDFNGNFQMTSASGNIVSGTPLTGTGAAGYISKWKSVSTFTTSLIFDNGVGVGIGTTSVSSTFMLEINGMMRSNGIEETSDMRYKKNIKSINDPVQKVLGLRGVTYNWRTEEFKDRNFTERLQMGLIAQEVEKVIPEVVMTDDNGWKSVEYSKLVALLIEAIKEQQATIDKQKTDIEKLQTASSKDKQQMMLLLESLLKKGIIDQALLDNMNLSKTESRK